MFYTTQSNQLTQSDEFENKLNRDLHDFKKTITILTAEFVQQPSEENRIHFMQKFKEAAQQLRESSLDLPTEYSRILLKLVVNFVSHVSLIGLLGNCYHYHKTGNWLFFEKSNISLSFQFFQQEQDFFADHMVHLNQRDDNDMDCDEEKAITPLLNSQSPG